MLKSAEVCPSHSSAFRHGKLAIVLSQIIATGVATSAQAETFDIATCDSAELIAAIETANGNGEDDVINLDGTCTGANSFSLSGVHSTAAGPNGLPSITSTITINGNGATIERSSVGSVPAFRILRVAATGDLTLNNLTLQNGYLDSGNSGPQRDGAGILNQGTLLLVSSTLTQNETVVNDGGAISNQGAAAILTLTDTMLTLNAAYDDGGGLYNDSGIVTLSNSTVSGNIASGDGGGIGNVDGTLNLIDSVVSQNTSGEDGGGIDNDSGTVALTDSTVSGNSAVAGGGIFNGYFGTLDVTSSTLSGNYASGNIGGGIANIFDSTATLTNSTLSGNSAGLNGGGLANGIYGVATLTNSTLSNNTASTGAGLDIFNATAELTNTIIANSVTGTDCNNNGGNITTNDSLIEDDTCGPTYSGDPNLGPLADNGGPTLTHALLTDSTAIDSGNACPNTDQRGYVRIDGACDIGAYEEGAQEPLTIDPLTAGQWQLISPLPLDNLDNTLVEEVVGNNFLPSNLTSADYGTDWIMYGSNAAQDSYVELSPDSALEVGRGYWLITLSDNQQFSVAGNANPLTPIDLIADPAGRSNLLGHPFSQSVCWDQVEISNNNFTTTLTPATADPGGICDTTPTDGACIVSRKLYKWNGSAYQTFDASNAAAAGVLNAFDGYFAKAYKDGYQLRIPETSSCTNATLNASQQVNASRQTAQLSASSTDEWDIRLIVSSGNLTDPGNLLGWRHDSKNRYDRHDLDELPADFDPHLTLVFPHSNWGKHTGDYTADYRPPKTNPNAVTTWDFEIRSDQPREITLTWEIPTQDLRNNARLIDVENNVRVQPRSAKDYTVDMVGTTHRFKWRMRKGR